MRPILIILVFGWLLTFQVSAQGNRNWDFEKVLQTMGVREGMVIGEAGAGSGFFTFHLSRAVGSEGIIYANDISPYALNRMKNRMEREGVTNIIQVKGDETDPKFPVHHLQMIVIVHAFHDFNEPVQWLHNTWKYVQSGIPLVIIEKDPDRWGEGWNHFLTRKEVLKILDEAGFHDIIVEDFMPEDNIYITHFKK